jgi:UDP-N-acetylglucosamine:LPS N-acetylglucosamine transferase
VDLTLLNEIVLKSLPELLSKYNVIHQCGDYSVFNDFEKLSEVYQDIKNKSSGKILCTKIYF